MSTRAAPGNNRWSLRGHRGDFALAALLALVALLDVMLSGDWRGPAGVNAILVPAMALTLAWRRTRPITVLALVMGGDVILAAAFGASQAWSNVFLTVIAVYSSAAYGNHLVRAALIAAAGVLVHDLLDPLIEGFGDAIWSSTLVALTFGAGLTGRAVLERTRTLDERAATLDREAEERSAAAAEDERRRIARELHDIISHSLGVVVLQAGAAERIVLRDPARARAVLESIRETGKEAIGEMGTLLGLLDQESPRSREPQPSLANVEKLVSRMSEAGLDVDVTIEGARRILPAAIEVSAFRVVQEGLTNAFKHAGRARVAVLICYAENSLSVEVIDDGCESSQGPGTRRGLAGLGERLAVFGGTFDAAPGPAGGWALRAVFPVDSR